MIDLNEQTRLLGQVAPALAALRKEIEEVKASEVPKPLRQIGPIALRAHDLAMQCTRQAILLSTSQFAVMKDGRESLALLVEATSQVSFAATLCTFAIKRHTDVPLHWGADETPTASRSRLTEACEELAGAATIFRRQSHRLSYRLASAGARRKDEQLIVQAMIDAAPTPAPAKGSEATQSQDPAAPSAPPVARRTLR